MPLNSVIVLFLGNSILTDDRIGLVLGNKLKNRLESLGYKVEILEKSGLALIDYLEGYDIAIIVDSIKTGKYPVGSLILLKESELKRVIVSPHYSGIFEAIELMNFLNVNAPREIHVLAIEVEDPYTVSESLSPKLKSKVTTLAENVFEKIMEITNSSRL